MLDVEQEMLSEQQSVVADCSYKEKHIEGVEQQDLPSPVISKLRSDSDVMEACCTCLLFKTIHEQTQLHTELLQTTMLAMSICNVAISTAEYCLLYGHNCLCIKRSKS